MKDVLLVERSSGYAVLTLNRPESLNAFNLDLHLALREALEQAILDENCRAIVITGEGRGFCAGQDLRDRNMAKLDGDVDLGESLEKYYNPLIRLVRSASKPVICAVNGVAAGAGANFALACDIVLAAKSAKFIQAFVKIGLIPDAGGTWSLTHLLGPARAKVLAMTGVPLDAEQAAEWGLIWEAVDDEELMTVARGLAAQFAEAPTHALSLTKRAIHAAATNSLDAQLDLERELQCEAGSSHDYREGVRAFLEKRQPKFTGKRARTK